MASSTLLEKQTVFFGNTRSQLRKRTLLFRYLAIINGLLGLWYLQWRLLYSINLEAWWFSVPLFLAELYSFVGGVLFMVGLWRPLERQVRSFDRLFPRMPAQHWPTVDVFITCYNEPVEMVEATAKAALAMEYIHRKLRVYILDDGASPEMAAMAARLNAADLETQSMRQAERQMRSRRDRHLQRIKELLNLEPGIADVETFLNFHAQHQVNPLGKVQTKWLKILKELTIILNGGKATVTDYLYQEIQQSEAQILQLDQELKDLSRCHYIARPKPAGRPHHAKAGNINYAIFSGETSGKFILTLDADHIPQPHFLKRVLPYFYSYDLFSDHYKDNNIAFVQTPQDFSNLPNDDPFGHQAHLFYGPIQQGKDGLNSAFYTGTNAILRREAVVSVGLQNFSSLLANDDDLLEEFELMGGMSVSSITEDMNTAMRLHAAGWESVYHNEILAHGLAPDDLEATLKQRLRWAQGTIQVLTQENPLTKPGLSLLQRLQYFGTMYSYFSGFATLIYLICPILYFFTGLVPVKSMGLNFALHFAPVYIINRMMFLSISWGIPARELWRSEQYAIALFPLFIKSVTTVFLNASLSFQVTPKYRKKGFFLHLVQGQILILLLSFTGMLWGLNQYYRGAYSDPAAYSINVIWAGYNITLLWSVINASVWRPRQSE
jgi:cellulose synthase (UDP-forming)